MADAHEIIVELVRQDWSRSERGRLFKNHNGTAWNGKAAATSKQGAILLDFAKKITYGLRVGSSDLVGWEYVEMYGQCIKLPLICSIEVKTIAYPTITDEQIDWLTNIVDIGGRAYVARETADGYDLIDWEIPA